eukprot:CAMPEP_0176486946 /NCGR_PEP_ID=MMETSP0200_2-20121128/5852_1 /TAXON_ID=947934 /ORGANISM="Chaetoceros sp., Strain GSL56" /LENGTH=437 /DNA_ID=CAMNT_0017883707 /DNA_START=113 /DNA_END=1423 /DNA_ORIENTATION=-
MYIQIHLKLIDLTEDLQQVVASSRGAAHDDHCDDSLLVVLQQQQQHIFESLVRNTVTKCGVQEVITDTTSDKNKNKNKNNKNNTTTTIKRTNAVHSEDAQTEEVISSILRYVKIKDRYMAFCSLLLKSFLHHSFSSGGFGDVSSSCNNHLGEETPVCKKRKIHILPRTKEGKPYIVVMKEKDNEKTTTTTSPSLPFNISHQFPFVGAAYLGLDSSNGLHPLHEISNNPWIGLDIVSFDSYNETKHLYSCQDEFLNVFQDYFTAKEWAHIQSAHELGGCRIKEFLLRWSIKEAYTKAIGTGMMTNFCSFESSLYHVGKDDDDDGEEEEEKEECREEVILLSSDEILSKRNGIHFFARIQPMSVDGPNTAIEKKVLEWQIIFVPLFTGNEDEQIMQTTPQPSACACICYPIGSETTFSFKDHYRIEISSFKLSNLIRFH